MNEEAPNNISESEASNDEPQEEKKAPPARKSTKKVVVRGVRDAKTKSARDTEGGSDSDSGSSDDQSKSVASEEAPQEIPMVVEEAPREGRSNSGREERRRPARGRRAAKTASSSRAVEPLDTDELSKRAWKIYQADVAEEGITLIDNSSARQLALRSFELARVFLEEEARQVKLSKPAKESNRERSSSRKDEDRNGDEDGES
jgi:hypothetical protein